MPKHSSHQSASPALTGIVFLTILSLAGGLAFVVFAQRMLGKPTNNSKTKRKETIRVAHLGNSIQYYNDAPRLLEQMLQTKFDDVVQDSCLRGGASLVTLWDKGNGMRSKFATPAAKQSDGTFDIGAPTVQSLLGGGEWDFVIMNDYTQAPARESSRVRTIEALETKYSQLLAGTTVVLLQTAAYRVPGIKDSKDLGSFDEFTQKLEEGYQDYVLCLTSLGLPALLAPCGDAFAVVKEGNPDLWGKLYSHDDFHPSPTGTWLEACVLYCTIVKEAPPVYDSEWFARARYFVDPPLPLPNDAEAEELRKLACQVCHVEYAV